MALTVNTNIINDTDQYLLDAKNVKGSYVVVTSVAERDALPAATTIKGSLCYVTGTEEEPINKFYQYNGVTWVVPDNSSLNLKNGEGEKSLSLDQEIATISYDGSNQYLSMTAETGSSGKGSINLAAAGSVAANHFLNIGNLNIIEGDLTEQDDGGVIAGYKHYSNSRATSLFGGWNRAINSGRSLITGYRNTAVDAQYNIISGQNNLVCEKGTNSTFGYDLINKWAYTTVIGRNNDPVSVDDFKTLPAGDPLKSASPLFIVGDGNATPSYLMQSIKVSETGMSIDNIIEHNEKYKESPLGEGLYFRNALANNKFSWADLILSADNITNDTVIYRRDITNRSNAMVLMSGGRLFLPREGLNYDSIRNDEVIIKKDLQNLNYTSPTTIQNRYCTGFIETVGQTNGKIFATKNNKIKTLKVESAPTADNDVVRLKELQPLLKLIDGLSEEQITALNEFAKSLTVEA